MSIISQSQRANRQYWVQKLAKLTENFNDNIQRIEKDLAEETNKLGINALVGHLRLCGTIPEGYIHDSTTEKLYSKYTDVVIHEAFKTIGFTSLVLKERSNVADVECVSQSYSFVADAKAFRLSRTAKNQKDFKIQALDNWKYGKPFAMVVCPVYQLPSRTSQIYQQAITRTVLINTYTHLAVCVRYANIVNQNTSIDLLHALFQTSETLNPSKNATLYWQTLNQTMLSFDKRLINLWREEKIAVAESLDILKQEALQFLAKERERIMKLSRKEAIQEILKSHKVDKKTKAIQKASMNTILDIQ